MATAISRLLTQSHQQASKPRLRISGLYEPEKEEINHAEQYPQHKPAL